MRVLIIEDERDLASAIADVLVRQGCVVDLAFDALEAARLVTAYPFDALVLDRMLPGGDGLALCRTLRAKGFTGGILVLTAMDALDERVEGLNAGADDYLVKPFAFKELVARLRAVGRKHAPARTSELAARDLVVHLDQAKVTRGGEPLVLTRKEYVLLVYFLRHAGQLVSHAQIADGAWDSESEASPEAVRTQVKNLRKKIERPDEPPLIRTVHGMGYRLEP